MKDTNTTGESNDTTNTADATREARLQRDGNGDAVGAAVWLNADELADLGVDVDAFGVVAFTYRVEDGDLHVDTVGGAE